MNQELSFIDTGWLHFKYKKLDYYICTMQTNVSIFCTSKLNIFFMSYGN